MRYRKKTKTKNNNNNKANQGQRDEYKLNLTPNSAYNPQESLPIFHPYLNWPKIASV